MNKTTNHYQITFRTLLLASILSTTLQITAMENPLEQTQNHQIPPTEFMTLPDELPSMIIAASKNQQALSETCTYFHAFMAKNKATILKQGLLELNNLALEKFLLHYGSAGDGIIADNLLAKGANPNACHVVNPLAGLRNCRELVFRKKVVIFNAIKNGHSKIVELLINYGANVNVEDENVDTPLHCAAAKGNSEVIAILLGNEQVDVNAKNSSKETPSHNACKFGNTQIITQLLQKGALINEKDVFGYTLLHHGCEHSDVIKLLVVDHGVDINARSNNNWTALHSACRYGYAQGVETLLENGALVDSRTVDNETPLHLASLFRHAEAVKILLDNGADMHAIGGMHDSSPLHYASEYRHIEIIKMLLDRGALVNQKNRNGRTPLDLVIYSFGANKEEAKKLLIAHGGETGGFQPDISWVPPIGFVVALGAIAFSVYSMGT